MDTDTVIGIILLIGAAWAVFNLEKLLKELPVDWKAKEEKYKEKWQHRSLTDEEFDKLQKKLEEEPERKHEYKE